MNYGAPKYNTVGFYKQVAELCTKESHYFLMAWCFFTNWCLSLRSSMCRWNNT